MDAADLRRLSLFDGLGDDQLADLASDAVERAVVPGEELFHEARPADHWWVLLDGAVELVRQVGHEETVLGVMRTPGQWAGGFRAWDEHGVYLATGRGLEPGRMMTVSAEALGRRGDQWFPFGVHFIKGLMSTVRNIESMARQREALVALGTLAAGLAHEINNPASAATRAVDALMGTTDALLGSLRRLAEGRLSASQFIALDALRLEVGRSTATADPLEVADREDALTDWLEEHDVQRGWLVAPVFASAGLDVAWCEKVAGVLDADTLDSGLEWLASSLSTVALLDEVKETTRRVSDLVAAVRSYSQLDRSSVQRTDVSEGLESTLVMLGHKLSGVTVVREYDPRLPLVEAIPGELNQVWTNVIDNAVDAMEGAGTLRVSTRADEGGVVVEIADTGPGIPPEVQAHAFEPFFTTKDVGKGTGLGLDISRRIVVDRHGGEIGIDSRPGATVVRVRLPARPSGQIMPR